MASAPKSVWHSLRGSTLFRGSTFFGAALSSGQHSLRGSTLFGAALSSGQHSLRGSTLFGQHSLRATLFGEERARVSTRSRGSFARHGSSGGFRPLLVRHPRALPLWLPECSTCLHPWSDPGLPWPRPLPGGAVMRARWRQLVRLRLWSGRRRPGRCWWKRRGHDAGAECKDAGAQVDCGPCGLACAYTDSCGLDGGVPACWSDGRNYCWPLVQPSCPGGVGYYSRCINLNPGGYCLRDSANQAFCGTDCSRGQGCPWDFRCVDVLTPNYLAGCSTASDCTASGRCVDGGCPCLGRFCGCLVDGDCPLEHCVMGACAPTGRSCVTEADCVPHCSVPDDGGPGLCFVGRNCAPSGGLTCSQVMP